MPRWFLSYHSPDQALAERIKAAIEHKDPASSVFFAPTHLRAGGSWTAQLAQELAEATAFILLIGQAGVGQWQVPEYDEALDKWVKSDRKFPLIVVLLDGQTAPGLPFLRQLHWIVTADPSSEKDIARIFDALATGGQNLRELWRFTSPYRGLEAMKEEDSDYFFGRKRETVEVLSALAGAPDRLPVLIGNSGVGKSSLAQAGVLAALKRQAWPEDTQAPNAWPAAFQDSRQWCFLSLKPGTDPLKALVESFLDTWQYAATDAERVTRQHGWREALHDGKATLSDLMDATARRRKEFDQPKPPGFFLYVDQGEELYARAEERQRQRFSELLAQALSDPRLHVMMSLRSDFLGDLQADKPLFKARQQIDVPPLGEEELREIVSRPAQLLSVRFESDRLVDIISQRTAEDSVKDVGALPLLSYTLDDMWASMMQRGDGTLRLPAQSFELGGVLVDRANRFLATHSGAEDALRRVLTLQLASVREDGEPTRRRAARGEFTDKEWRLVSELTDYPNRLLVTMTTEAGDTFAEVAHEAIFRRWDKLKNWIGAEREFLAWRSGLEAARHAWQAAPDASKNDALLMGLALAKAQSWRTRRGNDLPRLDNEFVDLSVKRERAAQNRSGRMRMALVTLALVIVAGLGYEAWSSNRAYLKINSEALLDQIQPKVLSASEERALNPKDVFEECTYCPNMVIVPAGQFEMGSSDGEKDADKSEFPRHTVKISYRYAVSQHQITFAEWDACFARAGCDYSPGDQHWGRGRQPVLNVDWLHAKQYADWLSKETGKSYTLLSEAEYEYAARGGDSTAFSWGDDIKLNGTAMANCDGCGSAWDDQRTAPVGSFAPNAFGLYDMVGNLFSWVDDCWHTSYSGDAPTDGSSWSTACSKITSATTKVYYVVRGGSYINYKQVLRSAARRGYSPQYSVSYIGFRIKRSLVP